MAMGTAEGTSEAAEEDPMAMAVGPGGERGGHLNGEGDGRGSSVTSALGCRETLSYAQKAYDHAIADGVSFDDAAARRCLLMLHTASAHFVHALALLGQAEEEGLLLAPTPQVGELLLEHLDASPRLTAHLAQEEAEAALRLFSQFVDQRGDERWLLSHRSRTVEEGGRLQRGGLGNERLEQVDLARRSAHGGGRHVQATARPHVQQQGESWQDLALVARLANGRALPATRWSEPPASIVQEEEQEEREDGEHEEVETSSASGPSSSLSGVLAAAATRRAASSIAACGRSASTCMI